VGRYDCKSNINFQMNYWSVEPGNLSECHLPMLLSVPPRYAIAMTIGYLKGKSAIRIHRDYSKVRGTLFGRSFWSRGYCVSTVGFDEESIRQYIRDQEEREKQQEQGRLMLD